jgi:hypothetical protein
MVTERCPACAIIGWQGASHLEACPNKPAVEAEAVPTPAKKRPKKATKKVAVQNLYDSLWQR